MERVDGGNSLVPEIKVLCHTSPTLSVPLWSTTPAKLCLCKLSAMTARPHSKRATDARVRDAKFFFVWFRFGLRYESKFFFCLFVWIQYANNAWLIKSVWVPNVQMAQRWKQQEFRLAFACRNLRRNRFTVFHEAKTWQKRNEWTKNTAKTLIALWLFKSSWFKSVWFIVVEKNGAQKKKIYFFFAQNSQANRHTHNHTAHT